MSEENHYLSVYLYCKREIEGGRERERDRERGGKERESEGKEGREGEFERWG